MMEAVDPIEASALLGRLRAAYTFEKRAAPYSSVAGGA
jgi:hypothetical protein